MNNETQAETTETQQTSISREEFEAWANEQIINRDDARNIADITYEAKMRDGRGYTDTMIRGILRRGYETAPEVIELIKNYYTQKKLMKQNLTKMASEQV